MSNVMLMSHGHGRRKLRRLLRLLAWSLNPGNGSNFQPA